MSDDNDDLTFYLTKYPGVYRMMKATSLEVFMKPLLQVMISDDDDFFLYCKSQEQSVVVSESNFQKYFNVPDISKHIMHTYLYSVVSFDTSGLINKYGILSKLVKYFEQYKISILCISTYSDNFILYETDKEEEFLKMIEETDALDYAID